VGTSGWSYPEWVGHLYPNGTSPARMLAFYARIFPTVEAHSTYRRLPTISTVERWAGSVPPWFTFAPKAHLGITHRQDLDGVEDRMAAFAEAVAPLGEHLGPVLFSLPHAQPDLARLERLLGALPPPTRLAAAFELSPAWVTPEVVRRIEAAEATLVLVENDAHSAPDLEVGPFTYLRLRRSRYTRADLDGWAERLEKITGGGREAWVFFKHDEAGEGPRYARRVMGRLHRS
jgi:uncharacterized protein YecE (DUF72 family)